MTIENARHPIEGGCTRCGCGDGYLTLAEMHVGLYCLRCDAWQRWISKRDAGVSRRSLRSDAGITPSVRARVLARDGSRCVMCGVTSRHARLVMGHIVSARDGLALGLSDHILNSYWNLCCMCEECNSGLSDASMALPEALRLYHRWLLEAGEEAQSA